MAITQDQIGSNSGAGVSTVTITGFSAASGSVLTVFCIADAVLTTSVAYNGGSFEELTDRTGGSGTTSQSAHLSVTGADGSPHDLTVTFASAVGVGQVVVVSWTGVETSSNANAHRTIYTDGTDAGDLDLTVVDSAANDMVVHAVANWGTNVTGGNQTQVHLSENILTTAYDHFIQKVTAAGANTSMTTTGGQLGLAVAFALVPSSGGPTLWAQSLL